MPISSKSFLISHGRSVITPAAEPELLYPNDVIKVTTNTATPNTRFVEIIGNPTRAGELAGYSGNFSVNIGAPTRWLGVLTNGMKAPCGAILEYLVIDERQVRFTGIKPKAGSEDSAGEWEGNAP